MKLMIIHGVYLASLILPLLALVSVIGINHETIYYGLGIGVYVYLTVLLESVPCVALWLVTRIAVKRRLIGNIAWITILISVTFLHFQPKYWAFPASALEEAKLLRPTSQGSVTTSERLNLKTKPDMPHVKGEN